MNEAIAVFIVLLLGVAVLARHLRDYERNERPLIAAGFVAAALAGFAQIMITDSVYDGGGDMFVYLADGARFARAMEIHPERYALEWFYLLIQRADGVTLPVFGTGTSTGTMSAFGAILMLFTRYSRYATCISVALVAFAGRLALYRVYRDTLPVGFRPRLLVATLLVPSAVMWSAGLVKEAFAIAGIGAAYRGWHHVLGGRRARGAPLVAIGVCLIAIVKAYVLFPLAVGAMVWVWADRVSDSLRRTGRLRIRPVYFVVAIGLAVGALILLGQLFPTWAVDNVGDDIARRLKTGGMQRGGSHYEMGDYTQRSLGGQMAFAPLALVTALFRPFIFEVRGVLAFLNAIETTIFTVLAARAVYRARLALSLRTLIGRPILVVSIVFTLLFGMAVGLVTTNFGSLSRYRAPLVPFFAAIVLVLGSPEVATLRSRTGGVPDPAPRPLPKRPSPVPRPLALRMAAAARSRRS